MTRNTISARIAAIALAILVFAPVAAATLGQAAQIVA
jgi:multisubunit Na+/H+ antiporter MnhG subunit